MALVIDAEGNEIDALVQATPWRGKRVLEIGCGDGRLTQRLARLGAHVLGIDPDSVLIHKARRKLLKRFNSRVQYSVGTAGRLMQRDEIFPVLIFSWVL